MQRRCFSLLKGPRHDDVIDRKKEKKRVLEINNLERKQKKQYHYGLDSYTCYG
jgi:hypothetical protein